MEKEESKETDHTGSLSQAHSLKDCSRIPSYRPRGLWPDLFDPRASQGRAESNPPKSFTLRLVLGGKVPADAAMKW